LRQQFDGAVGALGLPSTPLVNGSVMQSGALPSLPTVQFGSDQATVTFAIVTPEQIRAKENSLAAFGRSGARPIESTLRVWVLVPHLPRVFE